MVAVGTTVVVLLLWGPQSKWYSFIFLIFHEYPHRVEYLLCMPKAKRLNKGKQVNLPLLNSSVVTLY